MIADQENQFIEKWKRSNVNVFFDWKGFIFYLASEKISKYLDGSIGVGKFAVCQLSKEDFINAVKGLK